MNITIIGSGKVGGTLAQAFSKAGHRVLFGVRDIAMPFKGKDMADAHVIPYRDVRGAVKESEIIVLATPAQAAVEIGQSLGDVRDKIIIDTMNTVVRPAGGYANTVEAILASTNGERVVKCFNTTGYENMANPFYHSEGIDLFVAGDSAEAKSVAIQLARDIGFANCYDFGGNDKITLLEQMGMCWINLAILQKLGRNIAFKVIRR